MHGRGIQMACSRNCMVLLHLTWTRAPHGKNLKSDLVNCLSWLNVVFDLVKRWALRKRPKKAVRQIAQKDESRLQLRFSRECINLKILGVMGSFCFTVSPLTRRIPCKREVSCQLSVRGFIYIYGVIHMYDPTYVWPHIYIDLIHNVKSQILKLSREKW